jgi:AraC family transcriptional regulator
MTCISSPITLGKKLNSLTTGGFVITDTIHSPSFSLGRHSHERANIACVLKGSFTETFGRYTQECLPHGLMIKPPGETHSNKYGQGGAHCLIIEVESTRLDRLLPVSGIFDRINYLHGTLLVALVMRIHNELRIGDSVSALAVEGLTLELLAEMARRKREVLSHDPPRWLIEARDYVHEYFRRKMSLVTVAEFVDVHPSHLARMFRRYYGCPVGDYVRRLRLEYAARELTHSDASLAEVAFASGFYDQSHFTHAFKFHTGLTPAEFRTNSPRSNPHTKKRRSYNN